MSAELQKYCKEVFKYDPTTGTLVWAERSIQHFGDVRSQTSWNSRYAGRAVGRPDHRGYIRTKVLGERYLVHRLIFLMHHGYLPTTVDHQDGNTANNRLDNLRAATKQENAQNTRVTGRNSSGVKGVSQCRKSGKWRVSVSRPNLPAYIGSFDDLELAELVANEAREHYHGKFAKHN